MPKIKELVEVEGIVTEALPNTMFRVRIDENAPEELQNKEILCTLSGKMRIYKIRVIPGDKTRVQVTPYDESRGRIVFRYK